MLVHLKWGQSWNWSYSQDECVAGHADTVILIVLHLHSPYSLDLHPILMSRLHFFLLFLKRVMNWSPHKIINCSHISAIIVLLIQSDGSLEMHIVRCLWEGDKGWWDTYKAWGITDTHRGDFCDGEFFAWWQVLLTFFSLLFTTLEPLLVFSCSLVN